MKPRTAVRLLVVVAALSYLSTWGVVLWSPHDVFKRAVIERRLTRAYVGSANPELLGGRSLGQVIDEADSQATFDLKWAIPIAPGVVLAAWDVGAGHMGVGECGLVFWSGPRTKVLWAYETSTT